MSYAVPSPHVAEAGAGDPLQVTLSLLAVLATIVALGWLARRWRRILPQRHGPLRVVDEIAIGPKDKVVLLACGERQLLIGVGERGSTVLARSIRQTPRGDQS